MTDIETILFSSLSDFKATDYKKQSSLDMTSMFKKKSKVLFSNCIKDILTNNEPEQIIQVGHRYLDYLFMRALEEKNINTKTRKYQSFSGKLEKLNEIGYFSLDDYITLSEINKLRNKFSHDIFYNISKWNPQSLPNVTKYNLIIPKRADLFICFVSVLIKISFFVILFKFENENKWITFEDIPN